MPGNRQAYEGAMNAGHNAAWDQEWLVAIAAYGRAIQEFPNDAEAHLHLGMGLLEIGRLEDALKVYKRSSDLSPNDPIPLEKSADVLERMGRLREAAQQYVNVAEFYLQQRDLGKTIANWERATRLTPGLVPIHGKLAQAYERVGDKKQAVREYLTLAFNFQRLGDSDKALKATQRALKLDRNNAQVLNTMRAVESGIDITPPSGDDSAAPARPLSGFDRASKAEPGARDGRAKPAAAAEAPAVDHPLGPMGEAMNEALTILATSIAEGDVLTAAGDAMQGMEAQRQTLQDEAISAYLRADGKMKHPALKMNLGGLLVQRARYDEAVRHLGEAAADPRLSGGAYHALGVANFRLAKHKPAMRFLLQALQAADDTDEIDADADFLLGGATIYEQLQSALVGVTDEAMSTINGRFVELLQGKEWRIRVADTRKQLEETLREQGEKGLVDILTAVRGDKLTESIGLIDQYMRRGLYTLAMDEAHRAVEFSPHYLPVHIRMAEIMIREGRVRNAIQKYNVVARSYLGRGENARAAEILTNVLEMAPLDVSVRESLIDLLESEEKWDAALEQYVELANTHHQLGNFEASRETYSLAEKLAQRISASATQMANIKHAIADIDLMRLDFRKSQRAYEEILALVPDDERAHRQLVELNYRQNNQVEATRRLDRLLSLYAKARQIAKITGLLEEYVGQYPTDSALRSRLSAIYRQLGRTNEAIEQLDKLGELQLDAGLNKEAAQTIRQIIALNPPGIAEYQRLLGQIGG